MTDGEAGVGSEGGGTGDDDGRWECAHCTSYGALLVCVGVGGDGMCHVYPWRWSEGGTGRWLISLQLSGAPRTHHHKRMKSAFLHDYRSCNLVLYI